MQQKLDQVELINAQGAEGQHMQGQMPLSLKRKKEEIERKLEIQGVAKKEIAKRLKKNNMFLQYRFNPFNQNIVADKKLDEDLQLKGEENLINLMNTNTQIQEKSTKQVFLRSERLIQESKKMSQIKLQFGLISSNLISKPKEENISYLKDINADVHKYQTNLCEDTDDQLLSQIQSITEIYEENYFSKHHTETNIFALAKDDDDCLSVFDKLRTRSFCFKPSNDKFSQIKLCTYREISRLGRKIINDTYSGNENIVDELSSTDLSFKTELLGCEDILNVASGRLSSSEMASIFKIDDNFGQKGSEVSIKEDEEIIVYPHNTSIFNQDHSEDIEEIKVYEKQSQFSQQQLDYSLKCNQQAEKIRKAVKTREELKAKKIEDIQLHQKIDEEYKRRLEQLLKMDTKGKDISTSIETNKLNKNKAQKIKLQEVIRSLDFKNNEKISKNPFKRK